MSERQLKSLVLIPKFTAGLSMMGSALVVWDILKERQTKLQKVYHRLLLVMSSMDIILSFTLFLSTWPIPKDTPGAPWLASGNQATCTAQGFAQVFFMPALFYNAYLAIYYVLVIVYGWHEARIVPLEKCAHAFTLVFSCVTAFTALALDMYGSNFLVWCFLTGSWNIQLMMNIAWQWAAWLVVAVMMVFLSVKISKQFRTQDKYGEEALRASIVHDRHSTKRSSWIKRSWKEMSLKASLEGITSRISLARSSEFPSGRQASRRLSNKQETMRLITSQAALYSLSYLLTESSNIAVSIAYYSSDPVGIVPIWVLQYALVTIPLQGFWNCLIYFRPRYLKWKEEKLKRMGSVRRTQSSTNQHQRSSEAGGFTNGSSNMLRNFGKESELQCFDTIKEENASSFFQALQLVPQMEDVDEADIHSQLAQDVSGGGYNNHLSGAEAAEINISSLDVEYPREASRQTLETIPSERAQVRAIPILQKQLPRNHQLVDESQLSAAADQMLDGLELCSSSIDTNSTPYGGGDEAAAKKDNLIDLSGSPQHVQNNLGSGSSSSCHDENSCTGLGYREESVSSKGGDSQQDGTQALPSTTPETRAWLQDKATVERNLELSKDARLAKRSGDNQTDDFEA